MLRWISKTCFVFYLCSQFIICQAQVINVETKRFMNDSNGWVGSSDFVFSVIKNVQQITSFSNSTRVQYQINNHRYIFLNDFTFTKVGSVNIINAGYQHLRYNYKFAPRTTLEAFVQTQYNPILKLDFRYLMGAGPRFKMIKKENIRMYSAFMYMYEYDKIRDEIKPAEALRISSYLTLTLLAKQKFEFTSTVYFQPAIGDWWDYRIANDSNLDFIISKHISFRTSFNMLFDTNQPVGIPDVVYTLRNGLTFKF